MRMLLQLATMTGLAGVLAAQAGRGDITYVVPTPAPGTVHTNELISFVHDMSMGPIVKNAPYSAEAVTESIQQLSDGNRIIHRESSKIYRDGQGRERHEQSSPMEAVFINDPVAGVSYTLNPEARTARQQPLRAGGFTSINTKFNTFVLSNGAHTVRAGSLIGGGAPLVFVDGDAASQEEETSLGTQIMEGVEVEGFRTTTTIAAGAIGNERPIEIVDERWFSPDLNVTVMTRHADPRSGETTYKLTNIQRVEQVRSLFEVPTGYEINEKGGVIQLNKGQSVIRLNPAPAGTAR